MRQPSPVSTEDFHSANAFGVYEDEKTSFFIDGHSFYGLTRGMNANVDYSKLLNHFRNESKMVRAHYFTTVVEDNEYTSIRPLLDWLAYHGWRVFTKPAREHVDSTGRRKIQGSIEVELAVSMIEAAAYSDHIVLFSGNGNYVSAIEAIQRKGVRVTVVSSASMIADELRRQADHEVDLTVRGLIDPFLRDGTTADTREGPAAAPRIARTLPPRSAPPVRA